MADTGKSRITAAPTVHSLPLACGCSSMQLTLAALATPSAMAYDQQRSVAVPARLIPWPTLAQMLMFPPKAADAKAASAVCPHSHPCDTVGTVTLPPRLHHHRSRHHCLLALLLPASATAAAAVPPCAPAVALRLCCSCRSRTGILHTGTAPQSALVQCQTPP